MQHKRIPFNLNIIGMDLASEVDKIAEDKAAGLVNCRINNRGSIQPRPLLSTFQTLTGLAAGSPILKTFRVDSATKKIRFIATEEHLISYDIDTSIQTILDVAFSAFPAQEYYPDAVIIKPEEASIPYIYITSKTGNKFKKASTDGDYNDVGITAPTAAPTVEIDAPRHKTLDEMGATTLAGWINSGIAAATSAANRVNTTIATIIYDSGTSGYASIVPTAMPNSLQPDMLLKLSGTEEVWVLEVLPAVVTLGISTVKSIKYDSGTTGLCTIHLTSVPENLKKDSILVLNGATTVRVLEIIEGNQGDKAFRCNTGASTISVGHSVEGKASFRTYTTGTHAAAAAINTEYIKMAISASGISNIKRTAAFDLSFLGSGATARPISENDYLVFSVLISDQSKFTEGQIRLYIDADNYYSFAFNANALSPSLVFTLPTPQAIQRSIQRRTLYSYAQRAREIEGRGVIFPYHTLDDERFFPTEEEIVPLEELPTSLNETALGNAVWTIFRVRLGDLQRAGTDVSKSFKDISSIEFAMNGTAAYDAYFDSLFIEGSYELEAISNENKISPYFYVYRYRSTKTRAISNWSPPQRAGLNFVRKRVKFTNTVSADTQVDKVDIARFGGKLNNFYYIGTKDNDANPFYDEMPDRVAIKNPPIVFDGYKPFAIIDSSKKGTCNVVGTKLTRVSGDNFNTSWPRGIQIIINGTPNRLYTNPSSTTEAELEVSMGTLSGVTFYIPEPVKTGVALPKIFGVYGEGNLGLYVFGIGDDVARGTLFWLNGNSPDIMNAYTNYLEITSPSEPLLDGCIFRGTPYVFTSERIFEILPQIVGSSLTFIARQVAGFKGLIGNITVGKDAIFFCSKDGVYAFDGNSLIRIDADIRPLFPYDSHNGAAVKRSGSTFPPIASAFADVSMEVFEERLYIKAVTTSGAHYVYFYDIAKGGWFLDRFSEVSMGGGIYGIAVENTNTTSKLLYLSDGIIKTLSLTGVEADFSFKYISRADYLGDFRTIKDIHEIFVDAEHISSVGSANLALTVSYNNGEDSVTGHVFTIVGQNRETMAMSPNVVANWATYKARNISIVLEGTSINLVIHGLEPAFVDKPEIITFRGSDWEDLGHAGDKEIRGIIIEYDATEDIELDIFTDRNVLADVITLEATSIQRKQMFSIDPPIKSKLVRIAPKAGYFDKEWSLFGFTFDFEKLPEKLTSPTEWVNDNHIGAKYVKGIILDADTEGLDMEIDIEIDEEVVQETLTVNHDGRAEKAYEFIPHFIAHNLRINPKTNLTPVVGLEGGIRIHEFKFIYEPWAEFAQIATPLDFAGTTALKFLQRIELDADTEGEDVLINIEDGHENTIVADITVNHDGRKTISYDFSPVTGYAFRIVPEGDIRIFNVAYKFDIHPTAQKIWKTQPTNHNIPGFKVLRKMRLMLRSLDTTTLTITIDGIEYEYEIPSTGGIAKLQTIPIRPVKGAVFEYGLESREAIELYQKDSEVHIYSVNGGPMKIDRPFGHIHREVGTA